MDGGGGKRKGGTDLEEKRERELQLGCSKIIIVREVSQLNTSIHTFASLLPDHGDTTALLCSLPCSDGLQPDCELQQPLLPEVAFVSVLSRWQEKK